MKVISEKYEDVYRKLKKCFNALFGDGDKKGLMPIKNIERFIYNRKREDITNNLPENSLIDFPVDLYKALKATYISRDYLSGEIGCIDSPEDQLDGITNMTLLMYLSNQLSKEYKFRSEREGITQETKNICKKNEGDLLRWKHMALSDIMACTYVLSETCEQYRDYFSYGERIDDSNNDTFVIDLPYIGQICVHFGWEQNKENIKQNAKEMVKSILKKKLQLKQITQEQLETITDKLEREGVLPKYEGKLYEYVAAMPIEYIGEKIEKYRKILGSRLPEEITSEDIEKLRHRGLNSRELYYFFIKLGAPKKILNEISGVSKRLTQSSVKSSTDYVTIKEFNSAVQDLKNLDLNKKQGKKEAR